MNRKVLKMYLTISNGVIRADQLFLKIGPSETDDFRKEVLKMHNEGEIYIKNIHGQKVEITNKEIPLQSFEILAA
jgi:hypothetical protein